MKPRNILLFTGRAGDGKSTYVRAALEMMPGARVISTHDFIVGAVERDHREREGGGHMHPQSAHDALGVIETPTGHTHAADAPTAGPFPFVATGAEIGRWQFEAFFEALAETPDDGWTLAELAGGKNGHPPDSPFGRADFSYTTLVSGFESGNVSSDILDRVALCVNVVTNEETRRKRLAGRPDINADVMTLYQTDDFNESLRSLLERHSVRVVNLDNSAEKTTEQIAREIRTMLKENGPG